MLDLSKVNVPDQATLDLMLSKTKLELFAMTQPGAGFLGSLMCDHRYIWSEVDDPDCQTAWCNGSTICINPAFFVSLGKPQRLTLLVHELWHTGYDHMSRFSEDRCPDAWNRAADYVINGLMDKWGFDFTGMHPCLDHQFDDMTTEQVYELIAPLGGKPRPTPGAIPHPQPGQGQPLQGQGIPGLSGDLRAPESDEAAADIKGKLVKAIQASRLSKEAGVIPGETTLLVNEFLEPILPWEVLLERFYVDISKDDYTWQRPDRRYEDEYLPSLGGSNRLEHLTYYLDVSGSVTDAQITRFLSEVKYIHEIHQPKRISMVTFDEIIQDELEIEADDPFEKIEINGRGGTNLAPVLAHIEKHQPTAAIIFSDLECQPMERNPLVPVLWVVMGSPHVRPRFGQTIHINE